MEARGYQRIVHERIEEIPCLLTIGSIIMFNGEKHIVMSARGTQSYNKRTQNITASSCGFLKNIGTGKEFRANWARTTQDKILFYQTYEP